MSIPFIKSFAFEYGVADELSPLVRRVVCNNPGPFTYTGTGTYLIGKQEVAVIDPGPDDESHLQALIETAGSGRISHIFVTHTHKDHCGGVATLKKMTGAEVLGASAHPDAPEGETLALDEGSDRSYQPDQVLQDKEIVETDEWSLQAIHTPGHISNHLCFALQQENALFSGDHIMSWATTVVIPPEGDMEDYYQSLDLLIARKDEIYYPTHGAPITAPQKFVMAVKEHREMRDRQILAQMEAGETRIMDMVAQIYTDVDPRLHLAAALNVQAHLQRHIDAGRIIKTGDKVLEAEFRFA